jgi:hypothetical protein
MKNSSLTKYLWLIPALYVSYEFAGKLFEVLRDSQEFIDIISVIKPLTPISNFLAHFIGYFDFGVAITLIIIPLFKITQKYTKYIFLWATLWVFIPASVRYFGGVADFELIQVLSISFSSIISYLLYKKHN